MCVSDKTRIREAKLLREAWQGHDVSAYLKWLSDTSPDLIATLIDRKTCIMIPNYFDKFGQPHAVSCSNCNTIYAPCETEGWFYCPTCGAMIQRDNEEYFI